MLPVTVRHLRLKVARIILRSSFPPILIPQMIQTSNRKRFASGRNKKSKMTTMPRPARLKVAKSST